MSLAKLAQVLREVTGLDAAALGTGALPQAVAARRPGLARSDAALAAYAEEVRRDPAVRSDLVADLLVHETSFFRYPAAFALLAEHLGALLKDPARTVRVLSAPCSTGQEPASVAMALLEAGAPLDRVELDAADVSPAVVARARTGLYGPGEARGLSPARRARFTVRQGAGWRLRSEIASLISYSVLDLLDPAFGAGFEPYDVILCRNVLIYLTPLARARLFDTLARRLAPKGLLLLGHAEIVPARDAGFVPHGPPEAYAVAHAISRGVPVGVPAPRDAKQNPAPRTPRESARAREGTRARERSRRSRPAAPPPVRRSPPSVRAPATPEPALARARQFADLGRIDEALALLGVEETAGRAGPAEFHLIAVLCRALGKADDADRALTRALYLDPRHVPALRLAALVAREQGETEKAARLEARAERASAQPDAQAATD